MTGQIAKQGIEQLTYMGSDFKLCIWVSLIFCLSLLWMEVVLYFLGLKRYAVRPIDPNRESMVHFVGFAMLFAANDGSNL